MMRVMKTTTSTLIKVMNKKTKIIVITALGLIAVMAFVAFVFVAAPVLGKGVSLYTRTAEVANAEKTKKPPIRTITHIKKPKNVRALYMSQCAASSNSFRKHILSLADDTEINALVIDVKDFTGTVSFPRTSEREDILQGSGCTVKDMQDFIDTLHRHGIYAIARITVFQDPLYTKVHPELAVQSKSRNAPWKDNKGLSFVDVGVRKFWDYIVAISHEARDLGFDELNYDYVRYPSDGPMSDVHFVHSDYSQRALELEKFFRYLTLKVRQPDATGYIPVLSVDLFGMTTTNKDDLTIGQVMERATPYFDYIAPMTYPSHYPRGFNGYTNPNENVYGVIDYSLKKAVARLHSTTTSIGSLAYTRIGTSTPMIFKKPQRNAQTLRPWLQDFDYGGIYDAKKVRAQIQATYDNGIYSWMLWDPANKYTREALLSHE